MIFSGHSQISGVGSFIPPNPIHSKDLLDDLKTDKRFGIKTEWMDENLGIESRRYCDDHEKPSDISSVAAMSAISDAGLEPRDIGAIIYCGITGDVIEPGTAHIIQNKIGAKNAICKDVQNACHGFCDGILFGDLLIGGGVDHVLVVTCELTRVSRLLYPSLKKEKSIQNFLNRLGGLSVGDAAGAMILSRKDCPEKGIQAINTQSDGSFNGLCSYDIISGRIEGKMIMDKICSMTLLKCARQLKPTMDRVKWKSADVDHFVTHQVGKKPYQAILKFSKFRPEGAPKTYDYLGNVTTATLPINFELLKKSGKVGKGKKICLLGTGSGIVFSWFCLTT